MCIVSITCVVELMCKSYVIVISRAREMYGIYCTEARGRLRPRAEVNKCHLLSMMPCIPGDRDITILYPEGTAAIDTIR